MLQSQNLSDSMPFIYDSNLTVTWPSQLNATHLRLKSHRHKTFLTQNHWILLQVLQSQELSDSMPLIYESNLTQDLPNSTPHIYDSNAKDTGPSRLKANHLQKKTQSQKNFHCQEFLKSQNTTVINTFCVRLKIQILVGRAILSQIFLGPKWARL